MIGGLTSIDGRGMSACAGCTDSGSTVAGPFGLVSAASVTLSALTLASLRFSALAPLCSPACNVDDSFAWVAVGAAAELAAFSLNSFFFAFSRSMTFFFRKILIV